MQSLEAQFPDAKSVLSDIVDVPSPLDDVAPVKTEDDSYVMVFSTSTFAQIPQQKKKKEQQQQQQQSQQKQEERGGGGREEEEQKQQQREDERKKPQRTTGTIITLISDKQYNCCDF